MTPIDDMAISCRAHCICPPGTARKCTQRRQVPGSNAFVPAAAGLIVNMLVMGLWHGFTGCYIAYGLYHGVLLALTEIYQKKSAFYKRNRDKGWYKALSWFVTLQLVMVGFLIFSGAMAEAGRAVLAKLI